MADIFDTIPEEIRASMLKATSTDPEAHSRVVNLATKLNLPPDVVAINPQWAQRQADLQIDAEKLTKDYPATSKFLSDPNRAAVSRDEVIQHMAMEDTLRNAQLLEPGLFTKDVRDTLIKQMREKGHQIEMVDSPAGLFSNSDAPIDPILAEASAYANMGGLNAPKPSPQPATTPEAQDKKATELYQLPQGFFERLITGAQKGEPVPFAGAAVQMADVYELTQLANRIKDGSADDKDWLELLKYDAEMRRGTTFGGKVAAVLSNIPAFAGEIAATGGLYTAGAGAARKGGLWAAKKILNKSAEEAAKSAVVRGGLRAAGWVAGSVTQATVGMPHRVAVDTMQRLMPQMKFSLNDQGEIESVIKDSEDGFGTALTKAIVNQSIEVGTESAGAFIGKITGLEALKAAVISRWFKLNPTSGWSQFNALLRKAKWDGVLEEFGEERLGELLRAATGLESLKLDPEQYAVELVSFAALPMAGAALYGPGMIRQSQRMAQRAQAQVEFFRDLGTQATESKTRTRVPGMLGVLGDMAAQDGPVERVFAPVAVWDKYFSDKGLDPRQVAQEVLGSTDAYDQAQQAGHDIEIPMGAYVDKLAATEHNDPLSPYLRLGSADAPNVVEMQAGMQATEASVQQMLQLNQDYTALTNEQQTLAAELTTLQEQVKAAQESATQRAARVQELTAQIQSAAPTALQDVLAGNAPTELQGIAQELQGLNAQEQQAQQAQQRIGEIEQRQTQIATEIAAIEKRNAEARASAPGQAPEVVDMAREVYDQLLATGNTSDQVARAHSNMFARMAYIMATRAGMNLQEFKDRFVTQILGDKAAAPAGTTLSQEEQQRDAEYMAAVQAGDMQTAQRFVDEAALEFLSKVNKLDVERYQYSSWANQLEEVAARNERNGKYPELVVEGRKEAEELRQKLKSVGEQLNDALSRLPQGYVKLKEGNAFVAGLMDVTEGGGIDFEELVIPAQEHKGAIVRIGNTDWLLLKSGDIERGPSLMSGGLNRTTARTPEGILEQAQRREISRASNPDSSVSNENPEAIVGIALSRRATGDEIFKSSPFARDANGNVIPLSERFNPEQNSILFQQQRDAEYMAAVEAGDMETAQRLVDEAAKAAGYNIKAYHGGHFNPSTFNRFKKELLDPSNDLGAGFYFSSNKKDAEGYDYNQEYGTPSVLNVALRMSRPYIIGESPKIGDEEGEDFRAAVEAAGYDGIIDKRVTTRFLEEGYAPEDETEHYVVFSPNQIKSADPVTRDADGNVIPLSERFNPEQESILYQKAVEHINTVSANVLADEKGIPSKIPDELIGKRYAPIMADLLAGGGSMYGVPLQGGPIYAIINDGTGAAWASQRSAVTGIRALLRRTGATYKDEDGKEWGLAAVYAMGQDAHRSNKNTTMVFLHAVEEAVRTGEISKKAEKKLTAMIRENSKATPSIKDNSPLNTFPETFTAEQFASIIEKLTFSEREWLAEQLTNEVAAKLGAPRIAKVLRQTRDASFQSINLGNIIMLLKVDMEKLDSGLADKTKKALTAEAFGVDKHLSYNTILPGFVAAHFRSPVPLDVIAPTLVKDLKEASPKSHVQYLLGRVPTGVKGQKLTEDIVRSVNEVQQPQTRPTMAQAMMAAMNNGWVEYKKGTSRKGLTDFIRAIESSEASATLTAYDKNQLQNDVRNGRMEVFKLGRFDVWFGIKNTEQGKELVGVVNNSGLPEMLNLIMAKALEQGASRLDAFSVKTDKMPQGMLETLYGRHGWKVEKVEAFDPKYTGESLPQLKAYWTSQGWDEGRHGLPSVVYMTHDGIKASEASLPTNPGKRGGDDLGSLAGRKIAKARAAAGKTAQGNANDGAASTQRSGAAGDAGAGGRVLPRGTDRFIAELRTATESQLRGWGVTAEQRNAVLSAIDSQSVTLYQGQDDPVFPPVKSSSVDYRSEALTQAAAQLKAGEITREEYNRIASVELPLKPFSAVPVPATMDEVLYGVGDRKAGTKLKRDLAMRPEAIPAQTLEARLDIPAYREKGVWVVTLHEDRGDKSQGTAASPIAYTSTAVLDNVTFKVHESAALGIAAGKPKSTIATMRGDYKPMPADEAAALAEQAMQEGWVQVGMNPLRHAFFYDKANERPVVSADQVVQIGGMVLAKNPVYGKSEMYLFQDMVISGGMTAKQIEDWAASHSIAEVRQKLNNFKLTPTKTMLEMLGAFPEYLNPVVDFVMAQRQKLVDGKISPREVAKAYFITLSSIGSDAIGVDTIRAKANQIGMEFNPDPMFLSKGKQGQDKMRPEELAAWWFSTPMGQRALNAIEKGEVDREAWEQGLAIRDAYGRNDARERTSTQGAYNPGMLGQKTAAPGKKSKLNLNNIVEITGAINATKGDSAKLEKVLSSIQGIGNGKKGFIGHMLGMGDVATIDAVEMNVWLTGKGDTSRAPEEMKKRVALAKHGGTNVDAFFERIRSRITDIHRKTKNDTGIPDEVAAHIIHHWIWDAAKGIQTSHAGVYEAMRFYQNKNKARGSISFNPADRGAANRTFTIRMLKRANASTFMHEAAHFYLEVFNDLASAADAPAGLREDWGRISNWLGLTAGMPITTEQHETFARGFERYLMEGKAPAEEVRSFFARMRMWLIQIYRDVLNLNVEISDDIRGVFDRMVATETEIAAEETRQKVEPLFGTKPDGMDDAAWERYRKAVEKASATARERLQAELEKEILDAQTAQREAETARIDKQVRDELRVTREHIALALLRFGKTPDGDPVEVEVKLDKQSLLDAGLEKDTLDGLRRLGVYRVEGGVPVDLATEMLGYGSTDELVRDLLATQPFEQAVKAETKRRMDELHPSLMASKEDIRNAAAEAVRNNHRDDVIAEEVAELRRLIANDKQAFGRFADTAPAPMGAIARKILRSGPEQVNAARVLLDNSKVSVDFYKQMALQIAQQQLAGMKLREIRPSLYLAAARNAGARASRLAAAGDFAGALGQKEAELLNHLLYRESRDMQKAAQKQQRYLLRMTETAARERLGKANPSYREQVDQILERFNLIPIPLTQVDRRMRLADWITAQEANGLTVDIDPAVRDEAFRKDFREMTALELTGVYEAVKQIDHLAKVTNKLLAAQDEREFNATVDELVAQITANTKAKPRGMGSKTTGEKVAEGWDSFFAAHRKLASLIREMDGFVDAGPVYKAIMAPINAAGDAEAVETEKATEAIQKLFAVYEKSELKQMTRKRLVTGATRNYNLSLEDRLAIALNWGNEDNRQKLIDGYNGLTEADVLAILDTLTQKDWKFVQSVWDYIDSFWPRIRDKQERVYGLPPGKIQATPVVTKFGTFSGGYYPLKYAGARAEGESDADAAKMSMRGAVTASTTRRGHTKERVANVERPIRLELGVLLEHVTQVVHDLTHHEMLIDTNRLLRNRRVMGAIEDHYGEPVYRQVRKALEAIAVGNTNSEDRFTRALGHIRTGASVAGLGFNLMTSMLQAFGLINAIPRVGAVNMAAAVGRWIGSSRDMEDSIAWIYERSDMMRLRGKTMNRELNEIRNTVDPKFQTALMDSYFYLIQKGQTLADVPTWLGAYHKAMGAGRSEEEAIQIADQTVIDTQGGGMVKDLANVQRGGPLLKMWTTFYSYFNALWNMNVETVKGTNFKSPLDIGRMMVDLLILNSLPVAIQYALVTAMRGGSGDDEEWYKALAKQQMSYLLAQLVFVRELGGIADGRNYEGPAGGRFFSETYKLAKQVDQGEVDRGLWTSANKVAGILFHYPSAQLQRTVEGAMSLWEGKTGNPAVLIVGPSKEER